MRQPAGVPVLYVMAPRRERRAWAWAGLWLLCLVSHGLWFWLGYWVGR